MSYRGLRTRQPVDLSYSGAKRRTIKLPLAVYIAICALPVLLTALFYTLRFAPGVMEWASLRVSAPVRGAMGMFSLVYPLSLMEILCTAAVVWLIYYIVKTITVTARKRNKLKILSRRLITIVVVVLYIWSLYCWLWNCGYFAPGFAERNGFTADGVTAADLAAVTRLFADKANEFSTLIKRDADGKCVEDRSEFFAASTDIYDNLFIEFPSLAGRLYRPKSMLYSWLMSRTGYTGIYFALTGESNINTGAPLFLMPATVAHELAHQRGVFAEDEANFVGIAACVSSGNPVFEYAGWLSGLMYLTSALSLADRQAWIEITGSLSAEVNRDWQENYDFWQSQKSFDTGVEFIDKFLSATTETVSDAVDAVYDGYLRAQNQDLGIRSYGACVNLLVEYFSG